MNQTPTQDQIIEYTKKSIANLFSRVTTTQQDRQQFSSFFMVFILENTKDYTFKISYKTYIHKNIYFEWCNYLSQKGGKKRSFSRFNSVYNKLIAQNPDATQDQIDEKFKTKTGKKAAKFKDESFIYKSQQISDQNQIEKIDAKDTVSVLIKKLSKPQLLIANLIMDGKTEKYITNRLKITMDDYKQVLEQIRLLAGQANK